MKAIHIVGFEQALQATLGALTKKKLTVRCHAEFPVCPFCNATLEGTDVNSLTEQTCRHCKKVSHVTRIIIYWESLYMAVAEGAPPAKKMTASEEAAAAELPTAEPVGAGHAADHKSTHQGGKRDRH